ncbi:hypothetical protein ACWGJ7_37420, partial [Streptomyces tendae]
YVDPDRSYDGKRACSVPEGINKLVKAQNGDGDFTCLSTDSGCISRKSYHPTRPELARTLTLCGSRSEVCARRTTPRTAGGNALEA